MSAPAISSETLHATTISIEGRGVLICGRSGSGKSDLALRLIDRGALLVSDDYTVVRREQDWLVAEPPANITGRIEVRGVGLVPMPYLGRSIIRLMLTLDEPALRLPDDPLPTRRIAGIDVPVLAIAAFEASAPVKAEIALRELRRRAPQP